MANYISFWPPFVLTKSENLPSDTPELLRDPPMCTWTVRGTGEKQEMSREAMRIIMMLQPTQEIDPILLSDMFWNFRSPG